MATLASQSLSKAQNPTWEPAVTLRYAWLAYLVLIISPFVLFLYTIWNLQRASTPAASETVWADSWFLGTMAYLMTIVPAALFMRSRLFKGYWNGECVAPKNYLMGMFVVWAALEIAGILSLVGCNVTGRLLPGMIPAMVAFMWFTVLWPSGRAMVCDRKGATDDPEKYEEPR